MTVYAGFLQNLTYSAEVARQSWYAPVLRRGTSGLGYIAGGVLGTGGDLVVTYAGTGLNLSVAAGQVVVPGSSTASQGGYVLWSTATTSLSPASANPSNPRIDLVYAQVQDAAYSGASNQGVVAIATGTPTSGANITPGSGGFLSGAPSVPTSAFARAYVQIPAGASTISNSNILSDGAFGAQYAVLGPDIFGPRQSTGSLSVNPGDHVIVSSGSGTYTLPAPFQGCHVAVTNYGSGTVTIAQHSSEKIYALGFGSSGANSFTLPQYGGTATLRSDGASWYVVAGFTSAAKVLGVTVTSAGAVTNTYGGTCTAARNSAGNYTVTFPSSFYSTAPSVTVTVSGVSAPSAVSYTTGAISTSASAVTYFTASNGSTADLAHSVHIVGS